MAHKALTIDELYSILRTERIKGNGGKKILLSTDDEGNGYHECFFGISPVTDDFSYAQFSFGIDIEKAKKEYVILG